ncbi:phosphoribosylglycinamide formyltransferase [Marinilabilia salmonicolor]|jgi:phosphoribosylglycinamide formyltransferase-1|uniref:Phosphoribosylglycinamide formyltransferase n=1 Tax=Marinilabilia salmonicolor TaxID=989 RepID=A0A2T0XLQ0_9BACT|nr:phosphoribosylglycinamide formyltransferase [Marinilabilia salmonicolor]PRY99840.1 formyltetrahydrofolate-dependent phosphoribosylglycinamide formyltransferase [Marinilabilia salmonicolor]RCW37363.1 formyltetrahydrofolate-dependent phosphoribosylglycinamide formyltransferase [Marinilabilia salmonicolor]
MKNIVLFASGSGTNAENIALFFRNTPGVEVSYVFSNRSNAGVLERAKKLNIRTFVFDRKMFFDSDEVLNLLSEISPDLIVLAGFLWLIPEKMVNAFPNRIVNIHPALLPAYGGKGMYGDRVHQAVIDNGETESGITIHFVNEKYDEGNIIFQGKCPVHKKDTPETLASKIHKLEYEHYPRVIKELLERL